MNTYNVTALLKDYRPIFNRKEAAKKIAERDCTTVEEVLVDWDAKGRIIQTRGINIHLAIENYFCGNNVILKKEDRRYFDAWLRWYKSQPILKGLMVERLLTFRVSNGDLYKGVADLIAINQEQDETVIYDWKMVSKDLSKPSGYFFDPISDLEYSKLAEYSLQYSFYRYFFEKGKEHNLYQDCPHNVTGKLIIINGNGEVEVKSLSYLITEVELIIRHKSGLKI